MLIFFLISLIFLYFLSLLSALSLSLSHCDDFSYHKLKAYSQFHIQLLPEQIKDNSINTTNVWIFSHETEEEFPQLPPIHPGILALIAASWNIQHEQKDKLKSCEEGKRKLIFKLSMDCI